jgi:lycopene beta-cyclase
MDKPVIILGGGIWGSLLAWRLKEALPQVKFRLYEESSSLGGNLATSFRESDCAQAMKWLRPLISKSWNQHHIKFSGFEKWITRSCHMMEGSHLHERLVRRLGEDLRLTNMLTPELALKEGSFVIDTRNTCFYKRTGFKKHLSLHIELSEPHHLNAPVILDGSCPLKERMRTLAYYPMSENSLIICDTWYSENQKINLDEMRRALCDAIYSKGWRIGQILREEISFTDMPFSPPVLREEGRMLSLAGMFHDTTGNSLPLAVELIDRMVDTSFRFGELREVVRSYRKERERDRDYFRYLNRQMVKENQSTLFEAIYSQSNDVLERFSKGKLTFLDRSRITLGKSHLKMKEIMSLVLPYHHYPSVQYRRQKSA